MSVFNLYQNIKQVSKKRGLWQDALYRFTHNKLAVVGLIVSTLLILMTIFAFWVAPYPYEKQNYSVISQGPTLAHLMGTDPLGRDMLSLVIYGGQTSISIGLLVQLFALLVGLPLGALAGYYGGWMDYIIMRLVDGMMAFPSLLLAILIMVKLGPGYLNVLLAMAIVSWPSITRLVRGQFISLRETEYVVAAKAIGARERRIIFRHIMPNTLSPVIVAVTLGIPATIFREAGLSFIGIGIVPPTPSWGQMVGEYYLSIQSAWFQPVFPALTLGLAILAFTFVGDGLQDALTPKERR
jgi:ABC-type dipeptide/oligopeptide/nickel transport system permease subunit